MKKFILLVVSALLCVSVMAQRNCGSMEYLDQQIKQNPDRAISLQKIEQQTQNWIKNNGDNSQRSVVTIPVVVHVVYRTSSENISNAQIQSQIDVLNADFRRLNSDADNTWSQAADTEIEFCLASSDPNGNATNGITRTSTTVNGFGTNDAVKFSSSGGKNAWPSGSYLNFWVCNIGGGILGYAQFPGGSSNTDGVVNDSRYFGTVGSATAPFDLGRTATHEVGHWLNLRHIWGDGGCNVDDFVSDTPTSDGANYGCATGHSSCSTTDMVQNYMDYSDDACMNLYTLGQKNRMQALFGSGGTRSSLLSSTGCGGSNPPPGCTQNAVSVNFVFDNYPEETSWTVTNSNGSTVASGGTYGSQPDGSSLSLDLCLADGCYDFTISDVYGDGICCSYGSGSYSVSGDGNTYASGGSFGSNETTNFCVGGGTAPTCNDGIMNGNETGIDCGGSCDACPTCNDGIQNGNETDVDCGGPDCAPCNGGGGSDIILAHYFESGWDGWTDGGSDCYRYSGSRSWEGNRSIRIRDNSGTVSSMTSSSYNVSGYNTLEIEFYFYPNSMENGEDFWVRYYDGNSWNTVATYARGTNFDNNTFYVATVTVNSSNYNFPTNAKFRFQCDASANADRVYIDAVTITGIGSGSRVAEGPTQTITPVRSMVEAKLANELGDQDFVAFPNPVTNELTIVSEDVINTIKLYSITGSLMMDKTIRSTETNIDVRTLQPGIYMISVETNDEVMTQKFVKQ
ncbi:MAG: M43 family zinc metalloprotease [Saprospiraceae bacterium]